MVPKVWNLTRKVTSAHPARKAMAAANRLRPLALVNAAWVENNSKEDDDIMDRRVDDVVVVRYGVEKVGRSSCC